MDREEAVTSVLQAMQALQTLPELEYLELLEAGVGGPLGTLLKFPLSQAARLRLAQHTGIQGDLNRQIPRLEELAERLFSTAKVPTLKGEPTQVTTLFKTAPTTKHEEMLGAEMLKHGADVYKNYKGSFAKWPDGRPNFNSFNSGGVSAEYATALEAKKAAIVQELLKQRANPPETWVKAVKPQISEFAAPEAARNSWRVVTPEGFKLP